MGTYTYQNFQDYLKFELGNRPDLVAVTMTTSTNLLGAWINSAYVDLCTRNRFWDLQLPKYFNFPQLKASTTKTTVAGTPTIDAPTDLAYTHFIHDDTNDRKLDKIKMKEYVKDANRAVSTARSKPTQYVRWGSYYYLYPTPDAAYTMSVYYNKIPALLSGTSDVTVLDSIWDEVILRLAVVESLRRLKDYEKMAVEIAGWKDLVKGKVDIYDKENRDEGSQLKPDYVYLDQNKYRK